MRFFRAFRSCAVLVVLSFLSSSCSGEMPTPEPLDAHLPTVSAPELKDLCSADQRSFGTALQTTDLVDAAMEQRYGQICRGLVRQDGLEFGDGQIAYSCRVLAPWVEDSSNTQKLDAIEQAFGKRLLAQDVRRPNTMNPKTILVPAHMAGSGGVELNVVILVSSAGEFRRSLFFQEDVDGALRGVKTMNGAFEILEWRNGLGYEAPITGAVKPQCTARSVVDEGFGWTLAGVAVLSNCAPVRYRDFLVTRSGKIEIVGERVSNSRPPFCFMF